jgi:hypothetical protein
MPSTYSVRSSHPAANNESVRSLEQTTLGDEAELVLDITFGYLPPAIYSILSIALKYRI